MGNGAEAITCCRTGFSSCRREGSPAPPPATRELLGEGRPQLVETSIPRANCTRCTIGLVSRELDVMIPTAREEAVAAFGEGDGITVLAGGTIVMPELTHGRLKPGKVLMLGRSGLDKITREGGTVTIGATVAVTELEEARRAARRALRSTSRTARSVRRRRRRKSLRAARPDAPRGDLQAPLIALEPASAPRARAGSAPSRRGVSRRRAARTPRARRLLRRDRPQGRLRRRLAAAH